MADRRRKNDAPYGTQRPGEGRCGDESDNDDEDTEEADGRGEAEGTTEETGGNDADGEPQ